MISFLLLKICAFLFASTHLSFFPYFQLHHPEKTVSAMPSNNERTYIMVKVRPITLIARLFFFFPFALSCSKQLPIGSIVYDTPTPPTAGFSQMSFPPLHNPPTTLSPFIP